MAASPTVKEKAGFRIVLLLRDSWIHKA